MNKVAKSAILLMIATMAAKILGFAREQVLSYAYGMSIYTDVYITSMSIPLVVFSTIGVAISTTFIPIYCDINNQIGSKRANEFTNNIYSIVSIICIVIAIMGIIFTEPLVKVFAFGFNGETLQLAINFTRILIISILFIGWSNVASAYLQVNGNFVVPGLSTIPQNIIIIISIILSLKYGIYTMVVGSLIAIFATFLFQVVYVFRNGYKFKFKVNLKDKFLKRAIVLVGPIFIGVAVNQVNIIVDRTLASTLDGGLLTSLSYANRLNDFVLTMFITSIATVIYPMLSNLSGEDNKCEFVNSVKTSVNSVILLLVPISIGAVVLSEPIVRLLFERGAFTGESTLVTSEALQMYAIGMTAFGLRTILDKVFYSLQDTKTPMKNGIIAVFLNIILNITLIKPLGHRGLALATSISGILCIILFLNSLKNKMGYFEQDKILKTFIKVIFAGILMGIATNIAFTRISTVLGNSFMEQIIILIISVLTGFLVYTTSIYVLKIEELKIFIYAIKSRIKNK